MTVITKPISENKLEKPLEKALMACVDAETGKQQCVNVRVDKLSGDGPTTAAAPDEVDWAWAAVSGASARRRRLSATTTVCVFVATLVIVTGAIIGGVYIYRQCTHTQQMSRFRGWCGVPFKRNSLRMFGHQPIVQTGSSHWPSSHNSDATFNEQFDLDLGSEEHEEIYVPDFGIGRSGLFVHDFKMNLTGIVDEKSKRCFVIPLDITQVATPRNMFHILRKMWHGFYDGNMVVIRQSLRIIRPPINDITTTGKYISKACKHYTTFRLEKVTKLHDLRLKRSATDSEKESTEPYEQTDSHFTVAQFAGNAIVEFTILDD